MMVAAIGLLDLISDTVNYLPLSRKLMAMNNTMTKTQQKDRYGNCEAKIQCEIDK